MKCIARLVYPNSTEDFEAEIPDNVPEAERAKHLFDELSSNPPPGVEPGFTGLSIVRTLTNG